MWEPPQWWLDRVNAPLGSRHDEAKADGWVPLCEWGERPPQSGVTITVTGCGPCEIAAAAARANERTPLIRRLHGPTGETEIVDAGDYQGWHDRWMAERYPHWIAA